MTKEEIIFCENCGIQFSTIDEIEECICESCNSCGGEGKEDQDFYCWACEKRLNIMSEIAQGICQDCKSSIIRKLNPLTCKEIVKSILSNSISPKKSMT